MCLTPGLNRVESTVKSLGCLSSNKKNLMNSPLDSRIYSKFSRLSWNNTRHICLDNSPVLLYHLCICYHLSRVVGGSSLSHGAQIQSASFSSIKEGEKLFPSQLREIIPPAYPGPTPGSPPTWTM